MGCAIAIARTRIATNCTGCKITRLQTADLHTIAPDYCMQGCLQLVRHCCSRTSPTLQKLCSTIFTACRKMRHWSTVLNKMWDKELWKGALKLHKSSSALQKCTNIGKFCKIIAPALTSQLAWHFRRLYRSLQDCATKSANHLSTGNVGQHIMPINVLLLSSYTESTLVRLSYPLAAESDLFKHVSWENLTKSTPTDNMATLQCFFSYEMNLGHSIFCILVSLTNFISKNSRIMLF